MWHKYEIVTADKLNRLENAVADIESNESNNNFFTSTWVADTQNSNFGVFNITTEDVLNKLQLGEVPIIKCTFGNNCALFCVLDSSFTYLNNETLQYMSRGNIFGYDMPLVSDRVDGNLAIPMKL